MYLARDPLKLKLLFLGVLYILGDQDDLDAGAEDVAVRVVDVVLDVVAAQEAARRLSKRL